MTHHAIVSISRWCYGPMGTFGDLRIGAGSFEQSICHTLELPWRNNERRVSCIPAGVYPLRRSRYNRGGYQCWEICDVPGRDEIKIHRGNTTDDVLGCVVVGTGLGWVHQSWAVTSSRIAFRQFMDAMRHYDTATILILNELGHGRLA